MSQPDPAAPSGMDYRAEARSVRATAAAVRDARVREQLLIIAALYDRLAASEEHGSDPV